MAVWDQEHSPLSRAIIRQLDATPSIRIHKTVSGFLEGKRMVETGECYALVVIPDELEKNSAHGLSPATILYINNTYVLIASLITRDATSAMQSLSGSISRLKDQR
ncbi:MAG: ABC transporter permease [Desulfobacteraceae bacterium]|nr:ABC transporter permease [Desulfobacteraceae bacterium]